MNSIDLKAFLFYHIICLFKTLLAFGIKLPFYGRQEITRTCLNPSIHKMWIGLILNRRTTHQIRSQYFFI